MFLENGKSLKIISCPIQEPIKSPLFPNKFCFFFADGRCQLYGQMLISRLTVCVLKGYRWGTVDFTCSDAQSTIFSIPQSHPIFLSNSSNTLILRNVHHAKRQPLYSSGSRLTGRSRSPNHSSSPHSISGTFSCKIYVMLIRFRSLKRYCTLTCLRLEFLRFLRDWSVLAPTIISTVRLLLSVVAFKQFNFIFVLFCFRLRFSNCLSVQILSVLYLVVPTFQLLRFFPRFITSYCSNCTA